MVRAAVEVERTYDLPAGGGPLPDLSGVAAVVPLGTEDLDATYHDTADLRLARSRATLRRRTGGRDAGWHLKLPAGAGRLELTAPLRGTGVPAALRALVRSRSLGAPLQPVVRLRTTRSVLQLQDGTGRVLAEVADDTVTAEVLLDPPATSSWREVEVELVDGDTAVLDAVEQQLRGWGARPAGTASKLARALEGHLPDPPVDDLRTAGGVIVAHLRAQVDELVHTEPGVRRDEPDAVHRARVATRRLRSALRTFRPLLDRGTADALREELRHLAAVLGPARDAEVQRDRLLAHLASEPPELVLGPVVQRVRDELDGRHREARAAVVRALDGRRHLELLQSLDRLVTAPPLTERAGRPAARELPRLVARSWHRLATAHAAAQAAGGREDLLHEVRKRAKAARYAGEAVAPALGRDAERFAARAEKVQEVLGEVSDSAVSRSLLRELGVVAHLAGENGFTFGRLHGLEELRAERARARYDGAWAALDRRKVRAWLG
ncbi:MAG TPA: CYTH and CHAD domain-containing protein [Mycobacteriales bacterium]|nr:CYTH and CHAD domain-containing protein [Mycobacteriales bacterium]